MRTFILLCAFIMATVANAQGLESYVDSDFLSNMGKEEKAALLMVHFGTTHDDTRQLTIDAINKKVGKALPKLELREAYTSRIIIKRLKARGITKLTPLEALMQLRSEGYTRVIVQTTNVIVGCEYESLQKDIESVSKFFRDIRIGTPLLSSVEDAEKVVDILSKRNPADSKKREHVVFVGHGTEGSATAIYSMIDYMLKAKGHDNYHVGTIEGYPAFDDVVRNLKRAKARKVTLVPFMFVAGDHAKNDISVEWKEELEKAGFTVSLNIEGLGQIDDIQDIYVSHLLRCISQRERGIMEKKAEYSN